MRTKAIERKFAFDQWSKLRIKYCIFSSGISEGEMSELKELLTSVSKLEQTKKNKQLKSLYSRKDKEEAEAIRSQAMQDAFCIENPIRREQVLEELEIEEVDNSIPFDGEKIKLEAFKDDEIDPDFEFGPNKLGRFERPSTSKNQLVKYLESKNKVIDFRAVTIFYQFKRTSISFVVKL